MSVLSESDSCRYRAYISYSHHDQKWAIWLRRKLESYRLPRRLVGRKTAAGIIPKRIAPVFRDREELSSATDLGEKVEKALQDSANLIVICSPNAAASRWVNEEILTFKRLGRSDRIFCFVVDGEPNASDMPGRSEEECFPTSLRYELSSDGELPGVRAEPIAADARGGKDGKADAKLKLIAGIIGIGFDDLKRRDQHRRHYRMATVTAGALSIMVLTTGLAIWAVVAEQQAVKHREQAESLVVFILLDLREKLESVGDLEVLDAVGDKAVDYFDTLVEHDLTPGTLEIRSEAMGLIGEVRMAQGRLDPAMDAFRRSLSDAERVVTRNPFSDKAQYLSAQANFWIGYVYLEQGDIDQALDRFQKYLDISTVQVDREPQNETWLRELGYAYTNLGTVFYSHGRAPEALEHFRGALTIAEALLELNPDDSSLLFDVAEAMSWVGSALSTSGDLNGALKQFREEVSIKGRLVGTDSQNTLWTRRLSLGYRRVGETLEAQGEFQKAADSYQKALAISERLAGVDPDNAKWLRDVASLQAASGRIALALDDPQAALEKFNTCIRTIKALLAEDSSNARWHRDIAACRILTSAALKAIGDIDGAQSMTSSTIGELRKFVFEHPDDREATRHLSTGYLLKGQLTALIGKDDEARAAWLESLRIIVPIAQGTKDYRILNVQAQALSCLGRLEEARPIVDDLAAMGFENPALVGPCERDGLSVRAAVE